MLTILALSEISFLTSYNYSDLFEVLFCNDDYNKAIIKTMKMKEYKE